MNLHFVFLGIVAAAAGTIAGCVAWMVRGITFFSTNTDNWKMVRQAAQLRFLAWPSAMHRHSFGRAQLREYWVIFLALMQRLLKDRTSDYPNVVLALLSHAVSSVLLFVVASHYWSPVVGLFVAGVYLSSFWPLQVALLIGHVELSQTFMLLAVLMTQWAHTAAPGIGAMVYYFLFGSFAAVSFFSSNSSRKYLPLLAGAFLYSQRRALVCPPVFPPGAFGVVLVLLAVLLFTGVGLKLCAWFIFRMRKRPLFHRFAGASRAGELCQDRFVQKGFRALRALFLLAGTYGLVSLGISRSPGFYWAHGWVALGSFVVFLHVMLPNLGCSLSRFHLWFNTSKWGGHFVMYRDFFSKIGKPIPEDMRGAGFLWIYRFFLHVVPLVVLLWTASPIFLIGELLLTGGGWGSMARIAGMVLLSLSPILVGEITKGSQGSRANFPGFLGLLILIAAAAHLADRRLVSPSARIWFWGAVGTVLLVNAAWNIRIFLSDVWPARMAPAWLARELRRMGTKRFYTYATPYNDAFLGALSDEERGRYEVRTIRSLAEVEGDVVVVPGTSSKALNMESQEWSIQHGDFNEDPLLSNLIQSRWIERYALASFQTFGTSAMFVHESDVTSHRSLILREITDQDRWRGRAWILDGSRVRRDFQRETEALVKT